MGRCMVGSFCRRRGSRSGEGISLPGRQASRGSKASPSSYARQREGSNSMSATETKETDGSPIISARLSRELLQRIDETADRLSRSAEIRQVLAKHYLAESAR
jgi:hypothetical protein